MNQRYLHNPVVRHDFNPHNQDAGCRTYFHFLWRGVFHTPHNSSSQQPADRELTSKQLAWLRKHHTHQTKKSVLPKKEKRLV